VIATEQSRDAVTVSSSCSADRSRPTSSFPIGVGAGLIDTVGQQVPDLLCDQVDA
jgi:hypothetical protein